MKTLFFIVLFVALIIAAGCVNDNSKVPLQIPTPIPIDTVTIMPLSTFQASQNATGKNGIIEYRNPVKIIKPEDLQIGDLIQMSMEDSRYDINHALLIANISPQNNQFLIQEIVKYDNNNLWFGIESSTSRIITYGALLRDYPYKIGHASESLPQKCWVCNYVLGTDLNLCLDDDIRLINCDDPRIINIQPSPSTTVQMIQKVMEDRDVVTEFGNPERINKPGDLQIGDLVQRPINDSLYNKHQAFIITNISPQNNQYLVQQIEKQETWYRFDSLSSRLISFEVLIRDYPYKIGHASGPLSYCQQESGYTDRPGPSFQIRCYPPSFSKQQFIANGT